MFSFVNSLAFVIEGAPSFGLALPQKSRRSANGAEYESQGQARSASPLVTDNQNVPALKGRNSLRISAFQALISGARCNPERRASRLPWAFICRAVGAPVRLLRQSFVHVFLVPKNLSSLKTEANALEKWIDSRTLENT